MNQVRSINSRNKLNNHLLALAVFEAVQNPIQKIEPNGKLQEARRKSKSEL